MFGVQRAGPARTEPALTLAEPAPRTLGVVDQVALWANLGVSLLGPIGALFVLAPTGVAPLSLVAAFTATVVGTGLGAILLALAAVPGAQTGSPAMVLLRGLFGGRLSYLPTALNLLQCLGWAVFVLVVIADAAEQLLPWHTHWPYVVLAGALTTLMALRPLGVVRVLRRYALVAVLIATAYLFIQFARQPLPHLAEGSWSGFWLAADVVIAVAVSWAPLAADYSRHSRSGRAAFLGSFVGYAVSQTAFYTLGLLAFSTAVSKTGDTETGLFGTFLALPLGWLAFAVLLLRELDESFTNVYSTVVSVQNLAPLTDRRRLAVVVGSLATVVALLLQIRDYESFLFLLGSVFVPWFTVLGAAVSMGLMKGAIAEAVATADNNKTDGQAHTATDPAIDRMRQHISCVRALLDDALNAVTLPRPGTETALLELHTAAAEGALAVTALALQVFGRTGSPIAASSARRLSDARAATTVDQVLDVGMQQLSRDRPIYACAGGSPALVGAGRPSR